MHHLYDNAKKFRFVALGFTMFYRQHTAHIKQAFTVLIIAVALLTLGLNLNYFGYFGGDLYWISVVQRLVNTNSVDISKVLNIYIPCSGLVLVVVTSTATVVCLVRSDDRSAHIKSSITVILMNLGLIFYLILLLVVTFIKLPFGHDSMLEYLQSGRYEVYYFYYFVGTYMPLLLAVYNPLVVATRCQGTRSLAAKWLIALLTLCRVGDNIFFKSSRNRAIRTQQKPDSSKCAI